MADYSMSSGIRCINGVAAARFGELQRCGSGSDENLCCICLVEFEEGDEVSQVSRCMHLFHLDCIAKWLQRHNFTCPLCRSLVFFH
ncbi:conserved hypothetical protein [Ricinus communis]|uniref:RING-type domain-containing protein n=1 Tax=Ricinus communis TaxID=3988 RepID=B9RKX1_RICCO|nr:conserved hypothetical protein [Ricinus communis]